MMQRVQSLFLFVVLALSVATLFMPLASFSGDKSLELFCLHAKEIGSGNTIDSIQTWPLLTIMALVVLLTLLIIFSYKSRLRQIKLCRLSMILNLVFIVLIVFWYMDALEIYTGGKMKITIGTVLPLISIVLLFLSQRSIKKDEELVKSTDRLR
jgi:hypothetical protein